MKITNTKKMLIALFTCAICLLSLLCVAKILNKESIVAKAETCSVLNENEPIEKESFVISEQLEYQTEESDLKEITQLNMEGELMPDKENVDSEISTIADKSTYVQGTLQWIDDSGNYHPLREIKVNIFDNQPVGENLLGTVYTDNSGNFSFTFQNKDGFWDFENGGYDIFIRFYAGDSNIMVHNPNGEEYYYQSGETGNIATGSTKFCNYSIDMGSDIGQALQISQAVITARDYAKEMMGRLPSAVDVYYPFEENCHYHSNSKQIHITGSNKDDSSPKSYASWDPIMHEYGHHIQYELGITASPGGTHFDVDMVEHFYKEYKDNQLCPTCSKKERTLLPLKDCKDYGIRLAWGEAWPTVFGIMAQNYYINLLKDIDTVGDAKYTSYNSLIFNVETNNDESDGNEIAIIEFLWDLFDDESQSFSLIEYYDTFNLGHKNMWDLIASSKATTFSEFLNYIYNNTSLDRSNLGNLLGIMNLTAYDLHFFNSLEYLPRLQWEIGGSTNYKQNKFIVAFYDSNKTEILKTEEIIGNHTYVLSENEWNSILNKTTDFFYCSVWSYQDDGYGCVTGPYISEYKKVNLTDLASSINVDEPISGWVSNSDDYNWYKFIAPSSGIYTFYTEGTTDTFGELFSRLIFGSNTENCLTADDNSGVDGNFKIKYTLDYNEVIFIRVRAFDTSVSYDLNVHFEEHIHNYILKYLDRTYHRCECDSCNYSYLQEHSFEIVGNEMRCKCGYSLGTSVPGGGIQSVGDTANVYINQFLKITDKMYCKNIKYNI